MVRRQNPNLELLELAVAALGPLADELVFLGGCATGLLITDAAAPPIRATEDVDVITEVASLQDYHALEEHLRALGFLEDKSADAPICRWKGHGVLLDVMPTDETVIGFGNVFFKPAMLAAQTIALASGVLIRMVTAPWFLLTKLVAFDNRGNGDYVLSHDMEDIIAVIDGRPELMTEVEQMGASMRQELVQRFASLQDDRNFVAALPGYMPADAASQARVPIVEQRIKVIAARA